jgi:menaquinone-9 beta-reductase
MSAAFDADAIVVGGGPAGSVTAALLAEAGHAVILLDKASFPRHKACSEYITPGGARSLARLGLLSEVEALGAHRVSGMRVFSPGGDSWLADFDGAHGERGVGLTRHKLDNLLIGKARAAGVDVRERAHAGEVLMEGGRACGVAVTIGGAPEILRAPLIVGADGRASIVSRSLGLDAGRFFPKRTGLVAHYRNVPGLDRHGEMHVGPHGYAGLAPLEDGIANVAFVSDSRAVHDRPGALETYFEEGLRRLEHLWPKLAAAERIGPIRGVGPMAHQTRRAAGDGFLLVGDAAGFLDPFTGEGVSEALLGAILAAPVAADALRRREVTARALEPYRQARLAAFGRKRQVSWLVQGFIRNPALLGYAIPRLDRRDDLAAIFAGVMGNLVPAGAALSPRYLGRLLRP